MAERERMIARIVEKGAPFAAGAVVSLQRVQNKLQHAHFTFERFSAIRLDTLNASAIPSNSTAFQAFSKYIDGKPLSEHMAMAGRRRWPPSGRQGPLGPTLLGPTRPGTPPGLPRSWSEGAYIWFR